MSFQVYDAINENPDAPNLPDWPVDTEQKSIIEFHSCECATEKYWMLQNNNYILLIMFISMALFFCLATAAVLESIGTYTFSLVRHGRMDNTVKVR